MYRFKKLGSTENLILELKNSHFWGPEQLVCTHSYPKLDPSTPYGSPKPHQE